MSDKSMSKFSAGDSLSGYLYQIRLALLWSLQRLPTDTTFLVSIETLDDVTFENTANSPQELVQTKCHRSREATLTDTSTDLWKSLRVWFEARATKRIQDRVILHLLTTATAPEHSVASFLRTTDRRVEDALIALQTTAQTSGNKENAKAYELFLNTSQNDRRSIIDCVFIHDAGASLENLERGIRSIVFYAAESKDLDSFLDRLEGWWIRRVLRQIRISGDRIFAAEIESQMADLREQFKQESLPIDDELLEYALDKANQDSHSSSAFVRQIELTKAAKLRILAAIRDYYRAFEQRSLWLREQLISVGEIDKYERKLVDEWELAFAAVTDELPTPATEETKERAARDMLRWAEENTTLIRPRVTDAFITRGSLHMLSDELRIGWHPEFKERLAELFHVKEATT